MSCRGLVGIVLSEIVTQSKGCKVVVDLDWQLLDGCLAGLYPTEQCLCVNCFLTNLFVARLSLGCGGQTKPRSGLFALLLTN